MIEQARFAWGERTAVMGVLNLTPDSFSDGGRLATVAQAVHAAGRMLARGADLLDLGAQSTRPGAEEVGPDRELARLLPALTAIRAAHPEALLSIDTFHAAVAEAALAAGAAFVPLAAAAALLFLAAAAAAALLLAEEAGAHRRCGGHGGRMESVRARGWAGGGGV